MTLAIVDPTHASISFDHGEVHDLSVGILRSLASAHVSVESGVLAVMLTAARLLSQEKLSQDEEIQFLLASLDWIGAYFVPGEPS